MGILVRKTSLSQRPGSFLLFVLLEKPLCSTQAQRPSVTCSPFCTMVMHLRRPEPPARPVRTPVSPWQHPAGPRSPTLASEEGGPAFREGALLLPSPSSLQRPRPLSQAPCHSQEKLETHPRARHACSPCAGVIRSAPSRTCESTSGLQGWAVRFIFLKLETGRIVPLHIT